MGNYFNEPRWKIIRANNLLQLIHQVTIEIRFRKSLAQERFKSNLEFRNQIKVSSIKFNSPFKRSCVYCILSSFDIIELRTRELIAVLILICFLHYFTMCLFSYVPGSTSNPVALYYLSWWHFLVIFIYCEYVLKLKVACLFSMATLSSTSVQPPIDTTPPDHRATFWNSRVTPGKLFLSPFKQISRWGKSSLKQTPSFQGTNLYTWVKRSKRGTNFLLRKIRQSGQDSNPGTLDAESWILPVDHPPHNIAVLSKTNDYTFDIKKPRQNKMLTSLERAHTNKQRGFCPWTLKRPHGVYLWFLLILFLPLGYQGACQIM